MFQLKTGSIVTSHYNPNERYVVQVHLNRNVTVRREVPKVRGTAARRADKRTRRLERASHKNEVSHAA